MNRRILAALLVIGVAGAIAGGSTLAYFNDTEASTGNTFAAGAVDLQIDWEETWNGEEVETVGPTDNPGPVFDFGDLKPGDEGEATISLHLESNPAWVWFRLTPEEDKETGCTEPEADAEGGDCGTDGELDDHFNYVLWHDDGDNVYEPKDGETEITYTGQSCSQVDVDVAVVMDRSGSMDNEANKFTDAKDGAKTLVNQLSATDQSAAVSFSRSATLDQELTTNKTAVNDAIDGASAGGGTDIGEGVQVANTELHSSRARSGAQKVMVVLSDGVHNGDVDPVSAAQTARNQGVRVITIAYGSGADTTTLENMADSSDDAYVADQTDIDQVFSDIGGEICEPIGTDLSQGVLLDGDYNTQSTDPFQPGTSYIGFKWNFSSDAGNEAQEDSLVYDMDFYTEQRRHNDNPANPWMTQ